MQTTLIYCKTRAAFEAISAELVDWLTDYAVKPGALEFVLPESSIWSVRHHLETRRVNLSDVVFFATEDDEE